MIKALGWIMLIQNCIVMTSFGLNLFLQAFSDQSQPIVQYEGTMIYLLVVNLISALEVVILYKHRFFIYADLKSLYFSALRTGLL